MPSSLTLTTLLIFVVLAQPTLEDCSTLLWEPVLWILLTIRVFTRPAIFFEVQSSLSLRFLSCSASAPYRASTATSWMLCRLHLVTTATKLSSPRRIRKNSPSSNTKAGCTQRSKLTAGALHQETNRDYILQQKLELRV